MKNLLLPMLKMWFDMILSGVKTEEYREIKPYWFKRFFDCKGLTKEEIAALCYVFANLCPTEEHVMETILKYKLRLNWFTNITFRNGYGNDKPTFKRRLNSIRIGKGNTEWGAFPDRNVFILDIKESEENWNDVPVTIMDKWVLVKDVMGRYGAAKYFKTQTRIFRGKHPKGEPVGDEQLHFIISQRVHDNPYYFQDFIHWTTFDNTNIPFEIRMTIFAKEVLHINNKRTYQELQKMIEDFLVNETYLPQVFLDLLMAFLPEFCSSIPDKKDMLLKWLYRSLRASFGNLPKTNWIYKDYFEHKETGYNHMLMGVGKDEDLQWFIDFISDPDILIKNRIETVEENISDAVIIIKDKLNEADFYNRASQRIGRGY